MLEQVWETFNELSKVVHRQGRRIEDLEARMVELERRLRERDADGPPERPTLRVVEVGEVTS